MEGEGQAEGTGALTMDRHIEVTQRSLRGCECKTQWAQQKTFQAILRRPLFGGDMGKALGSSW